MKLFQRVYTNLKSGAEVTGPWRRNFVNATIAEIPGEGYMRGNSNYSVAVMSKKVGWREWVAGKPKS